METLSVKKKNLLGWIGTVCLLLILPIKLLRFVGVTFIPLIIGVAPSILGSSGLLFLLLSSTGRLSRLTPIRATFIAGVVAVGLELLQLVPRPGILHRVQYTFDYNDLAASVLSLVVAYFVIWRITKGAETTEIS